MSLNYSHLPDWLEKNRVFRFFFLLRKLFLIKKRFTHHAQFAEDVSIIRHFPKHYRGFFVDVGCFHPVKYNNTYKLYKKGWRGVNIDIDSIKIAGFDVVRPGDTNIACAVSDRTGEIKFWTNGFYSLTVTLDEEFAKGAKNYRSKTVQADTLTNILNRTPYRGRTIDFLSIDAEGHDLEVLKSLDLKIYRPTLIAIETHLTILDDVANTELYQYLVAREYALANWVGLTLLFRSKDDIKTY